MRLSRAAALQLSPLAPAALAFEYHGTAREGLLETIGEGPGGAFLLIRHADGSCKSYSLAKMSGLRAADPPAPRADDFSSAPATPPPARAA